MKQPEHMVDETERTLRSWDEEPALLPDPFLAARIQEMHREGTVNRWRFGRLMLELRYAAILTLMVLNMITILFLEFSSRPDPSKDLVTVLRDDFQIEPSQDTP